MAMNRTLRGLIGFASLDYSAAPCPAMLLAITTATPDEIRPAAQDAIRKVRGLHTPTPSIADLTLLELDYAFTNLGYFMSCVGNYRDRTLTLIDWAQRPRSPGICYVVEAIDPAATDRSAGHVVAVLGGNLVCCENRDITGIDRSTRRDHLAGQVFTIAPMTDVRWSA